MARAFDDAAPHVVGHAAQRFQRQLAPPEAFAAAQREHRHGELAGGDGALVVGDVVGDGAVVGEARAQS
jgi:hypothetical protein